MVQLNSITTVEFNTDKYSRRTTFNISIDLQVSYSDNIISRTYSDTIVMMFILFLYKS